MEGKISSLEVAVSQLTGELAILKAKVDTKADLMHSNYKISEIEKKVDSILEKLEEKELSVSVVMDGKRIAKSVYNSDFGISTYKEN
ncbi:hypothetical protein [Bacillus sp. FSL K6-3431]|uniref:hypothetical protein n=1 Tax=Bacillus sp. FSL K6-3431 TaxID=2921500 RepID=UPI0030F6C28D